MAPAVFIIIAFLFEGVPLHRKRSTGIGVIRRAEGVANDNPVDVKSNGPLARSPLEGDFERPFLQRADA